MFTPFMNMDYETYNAMMEVSNRLIEKVITYFKENQELILEAYAAMNPNTSYIPAFAR